MAQTVDADSAIGLILGQASLSNAQLRNGSIDGRHFVGWALPTIASKTTYGSMSEFLKRWAVPTLRLIGLGRGFGAAFGFLGCVLDQLVGVGLIQREQKRDVFHFNTVGAAREPPPRTWHKPWMRILRSV